MGAIRKGVSASIAGVVIAACVVPSAFAHHPIRGKFDDTKPIAFAGVVTRVDWRDPHVHVFVNVEPASGSGDTPTNTSASTSTSTTASASTTTATNTSTNWAVELESRVLLRKSGWRRDSLKPGDRVAVRGIAARDGTRQVWGESVVLEANGREILKVTATEPVAARAARPSPRWPDGKPVLGAPDVQDGYWSYPTSTALVEDGANVDVDADGLLRDLDDAERVAPMQPWALGLYKHRQRRHLRDDPLFLNCKPPGGVRHLQSPLGIQLVEDRERQRIFVLMGSGNRNFRIIYLDGRPQQGQVGGDDDNPLYYGRSVGRWEGDTLVVDTGNFNEDFWFTNGGLPHTDKLRLIERFSRPDFDTLRYEVSVEDPGAYTRSWSSSWELKWVGGEELPSYFCQDNRS